MNEYLKSTSISTAVFFFLEYSLGRYFNLIYNPIMEFIVIFLFNYMMKKDINFSLSVSFISVILLYIIKKIIKWYMERKIITEITNEIGEKEQEYKIDEPLYLDNNIGTVPEEGRGLGCVPLTLPIGVATCCSTCSPIPTDTGGSIIELSDDETILPFNK